MNRTTITVFLVFSVFLLPYVSAYNLTYYIQDTSTIANVTSVYWPENCRLEMYVRDTAGASGSYSVINRYYSPDLIQVAYGANSFSTNITCKAMNTDPIISQTSLNDYYEASVQTTHSADTFTGWLEVRYICDVDSEEMFIYNNTMSMDSYGNHPFGYGAKFGTCYAQSPSQCTNDLTGDLGDVIDYLQSGYYTTCGENLRVDREGESHTTATCGGIQSDIDMNYWTMIPFNSMPSGLVNVTVTDRAGYKSNPAIGGTIQYQNQYYLWDTETNSTSDWGTASTLNRQEQLEADREYWLFIGTRIYMDNYNCGTNSWGVVHNYTTYDISIWAYEPDWVCGEWSDCAVDGSRSRVCTDPAERISDRIEQETCVLTVIENATLGFEDTQSVTNTICYPRWDVITATFGIITGQACVYDPTNITIERPVGWSVTGDSIYFNRYFMDFTSEWASEGTRSLKLWTIPPKDHEIDWSGSATYCTNKTVSDFPIIENTFSNTTMRVNFNVTFPATNMRISFDAKTCDGQVRQHYPLTALNGTWIPFQVCPEYCYASDCTTQPLGNFYFDLWDDVADESILGGSVYHQSLTDRRQSLDVDLTGSGLVVGRNYTLSFAVFSENPQDTRGNCIMLDNVRYDVLATAYLDVMGGRCESQCVGNDYYQARLLPDGECFVKRTIFAENCMDESLAESIETNTDVCFDSDTLLHYNDVLADYEEIDCEYGCEDGHCLTEEEAEALETQTGQLTRSSARSLLYSVFWSPLFWFSMIVFSLAGVIARLTGKNGGILGAGFAIFMFLMGGITEFIAGVTIVPFWISLAVITFMALLLAYELRRAGFGGG